MKRAIVTASLTATAGLLAANASADVGLYLSHIDTTAAASIPDPDAAALLVDMAFADSARAGAIIAEATSLEVTTLDAPELRLSVPRAGTLRGEPESRHLAASFVIDYSETPVADLAQHFRARHETGDASRLVEQLTRFVDTVIADKTMKHGFRLASQVAGDGAGDCTEHAVLLVALARALELPARVAVGVLLVDRGEGLNAYGHAWAEIHDGRTWRIADATRPEAAVDGGWLRYVPLAALDNEGPGFRMNALQWLVAVPAAVRAVVEVVP